MELAETLYVESLTNAARAVALRHEALQLLDKLPPQFKTLRSTLRWRRLVSG